MAYNPRIIRRRIRLRRACDRILAVQREVNAMPVEQRNWFWSKPGHKDMITVARALRATLGGEKL